MNHFIEFMRNSNQLLPFDVLLGHFLLFCFSEQISEKFGTEMIWQIKLCLSQIDIRNRFNLQMDFGDESFESEHEYKIVTTFFGTIVSDEFDFNDGNFFFLKNNFSREKVRFSLKKSYIVTCSMVKRLKFFNDHFLFFVIIFY